MRHGLDTKHLFYIFLYLENKCHVTRVVVETLKVIFCFIF